MATVYLTLSAKKDATNKQEIMIRFSHGRINQRAKTNIFIPAEYWDETTQQIIVPNFRLMSDEKKELKQYLTERSEKLNALINTIQTAFNETEKDGIAPDWLKDCMDMYYQRGKYTPVAEKPEAKYPFFDAFNEFLAKRKLSDVRKKNFRVIVRAMERYELYTRKTSGRDGFALSFDNITPDTLDDITRFLRREHEIRNKHPEIYEQCPQYHEQKPRGQNTINDMLTKLRTFFIWAVDNGKTNSNPFHKYTIEECVYGTPYYISVEERNKLYYTDLSFRPALETQRDIFIFQCVIGCRVADLYGFTKQNVINGAVEYIARKTKDGRPITVRVPLNSIAKGILDKYAGFDGGSLLPFISSQKYNDAIKEAFTAAGLTRPVMTLDPLTRESVIRPLNEIASSHLARRCFVGNLYKQVKDPNLVGALSGHKEGSKAFARYREIDEALKNELVKMLE